MLKSKTNYSDFINSLKQLAYRCKEEVFSKYPSFPCKVIELENKQPTIRLMVNSSIINFKLKSVRTSFAKEFWIAKVIDVQPNNNYILFSKTEGHWLYVNGETIIKDGERKKSEFHKGTEMYVVNRRTVKDLNVFLKKLKEKEEKKIQKKLSFFD